MSVCSSLQVRGLPVVTQSDQEVGHLLGFNFDTARGSIVHIIVRPRGFVRGLVAQELLIAWSDVIAWSEQEVRIKDASIRVDQPMRIPSVVPCKGI